MAFHSSRSKSKKSIKFWSDPLEAQPLEPNTVGSKGSFRQDTVTHVANMPRCECPSSLMNTTKLVSIVGGLWKFVGQPAELHTKESLNCHYVFDKASIESYDSQRSKVTARKSDSVSDDHKIPFISVRSDLQNLENVKNLLLFSSCSITNSIFWNRANVNDAPLQGFPQVIDKVGCLWITKQLDKTKVSVEVTPLFYVKQLLRLNGSGCDNLAETFKHEENSISVFSRIPDAKTKASEYSREETIYPPGSMPKSCCCVGSVCASETVSSDEQLVAYSGCKVEEFNTQGTCDQLQHVPDSLSRDKDYSDGGFTGLVDMTNETRKNVIHEYDIGKEYFLKQWSSMPDKLQHAFEKHKHAFAGALAGTSVSLCLHPVDTLKTIIQSKSTGERSLFRVFKMVISEKGVMGLYRGITSNIASSAPISAIYTFTYESVKGALLPLLPKEYHCFGHCAAGGCSSIATSFVFTPSECIKQQMQVGMHQSCWNALIGCLQKGGLASLYAGWGAVLCRNIPHSIIKFYTYESLKQMLSSKNTNATLSTLQTLVCGGLAGSTAALFTTPFDVVKTKLQTQAPGSRRLYNGVFHALNEIARQEGLQGLYRGLTPRLAMYVSQGAIFFASYEFFKALFSLKSPSLPVPPPQEQQECACA